MAGTEVRALTVRPGVEGSARVERRPAPAAGPGELELAPLLVGVCGTDAEIVGGGYGTAPDGAPSLVLGHEAVARVVGAGAGDGAGATRPAAPGDLVVPIVRRPDPVPCGACAVGEWDMCRTGRYTEHGIKGLDGFAAERVVVHADHVVAVPAGLETLAVLTEPTSVVAKAWEQIERIGHRAAWSPRVVLVTGAGPIGLLAALLARQRGFETHVLDRIEDGPKPALVAALGATYHVGDVADAGPPPDVIVECTGVGRLVLDAMERNRPSGIVCLAGISSGTRTIDIDAAALNRRIVLENDVVFGTVNANRRHYEQALTALADADPSWLAQLVSRRVPLDHFVDAFAKGPDDVKVVLDVTA
jgi:threonine dehydrogenase-like Zn-dependent dehydrogenase